MTHPGVPLEGLDYAHTLTDDRGQPLAIVHRDVSPRNVMLGFDGDVRVIDFGLAASTVKVERTEANIVLGKVPYMAPEQVRGARPDARADVFAVAVIRYELLVGKRFNDGVDPCSLSAVVASGTYLPPGFAALDPDLRAVLWRALATDRNRRTRSANLFAEELRVYAQTHGQRAAAAVLRQLMRDVFGAPREPWEVSAASRPAPAAPPAPTPASAPGHATTTSPVLDASALSALDGDTVPVEVVEPWGKGAVPQLPGEDDRDGPTEADVDRLQGLSTTVPARSVPAAVGDDSSPPTLTAPPKAVPEAQVVDRRGVVFGLGTSLDRPAVVGVAPVVVALALVVVASRSLPTVPAGDAAGPPSAAALDAGHVTDAGSVGVLDAGAVSPASVDGAAAGPASVDGGVFAAPAGAALVDRGVPAVSEGDALVPASVAGGTAIPAVVDGGAVLVRPVLVDAGAGGAPASPDAGRR